jgi:hypothetical protein
MRIYFAGMFGFMCMILAKQWEEVAPLAHPMFMFATTAIGWALAGWRPIAKRLRVLAAFLAICTIALTAALTGPETWIPVVVVGSVLVAPTFVLAVAFDVRPKVPVGPLDAPGALAPDDPEHLRRDDG